MSSVERIILLREELTHNVSLRLMANIRVHFLTYHVHLALISYIDSFSIYINGFVSNGSEISDKL